MYSPEKEAQYLDEKLSCLGIWIVTNLSSHHSRCPDQNNGSHGKHFIEGFERKAKGSGNGCEILLPYLAIACAQWPTEGATLLKSLDASEEPAIRSFSASLRIAAREQWLKINTEPSVIT
jgi:hypothetical protein